jgi:hypothetical protein
MIFSRSNGTQGVLLLLFTQYRSFSNLRALKSYTTTFMKKLLMISELTVFFNNYLCKDLQGLLHLVGPVVLEVRVLHLGRAVEIQEALRQLLRIPQDLGGRRAQ